MFSTIFGSVEALALVDGLVDAVYVMDPETYDLVYVNQAFNAIWGGDVLGQKCHEVLQGRSQPCSFCTNDRILGENLGKTWVWEFQNEKSGRWFRCVDKALKSADGRWLRYEVATDITDRKALETALRTSEQKLEREVAAREERLQELSAYSRRLIEASLDPLMTISPEGVMTDVNRATEEVTGLAREQLIGNEFAGIFTEPERARTGYQQVLQIGTLRDYPLTVRHISGKTIEVLFHASLFKNERGELQGIFAAARDVTERNHLARVILQSRDFLNQTGQLAHVGGWEVDLKTNRQVWTDEVYRIHEVDLDFQPVVENGISFYAPESVPVITQAFTRAAEQGEPFDLELQLITAKGKRIWVRSIGQAYRENGKIVKVGGVFQDITERKAIEDELRKKRDHLEELVSQRTRDLERVLADFERSNRDLEQFAYVASHDLQEPLRMIASFTQLLEERLRDQLDEKAKKYMNYVIDGARRMHCLINDLLEYSRVGTRGKPFGRVDCRKVVATVLQSLRRSIAETRAEIQVRDLPVVYGDDTQLGQLFQNLISNAIKFHGEAAPRVVVSAQKEEQGWVFVVQDHGIGIDARHFDKIFIIFQRLHERGKFPGSGIGLSIAKKIVERHKGRIWVESQPGQGTSFFFTIPQKPEFLEDPHA